MYVRLGKPAPNNFFIHFMPCFPLQCSPLPILRFFIPKRHKAMQNVLWDVRSTTANISGSKFLVDVSQPLKTTLTLKLSYRFFGRKPYASLREPYECGNSCRLSENFTGIEQIFFVSAAPGLCLAHLTHRAKQSSVNTGASSGPTSQAISYSLADHCTGNHFPLL